MCYVIQYMNILSSAALFVITLIIVIGICNFSASFITDIEENLRTLNNEIITSKNRKLSLREWVKIKQKFIEIIQFHADAIELRFSYLFVPIDCYFKNDFFCRSGLQIVTQTRITALFSPI